MEDIRIIDTGDGSHSLLNTTLQETYHSVHGAVTESTYVFIDQGLRMAEVTQSHEPLSILEIGFGTGLNALLTFMEANRQKRNVVYESWERFPLPAAVWQQLNYGQVLGDSSSYQLINEAPWDVRTPLTPHFDLHKRKRDVVTDPIDGHFDLIYYDAFAPSRQPEMWTQELLKKVTDRLNPGGIWVTYCAKGQVKRDLSALGLTVETLPGPPGKKEMTRATRPMAP